MNWVCNCAPHAVDMTIAALPGGHRIHRTGNPVLIGGARAVRADQVIRYLVGIYCLLTPEQARAELRRRAYISEQLAIAELLEQTAAAGLAALLEQNETRGE